MGESFLFSASANKEEDDDDFTNISAVGLALISDGLCLTILPLEALRLRRDAIFVGESFLFSGNCTSEEDDDDLLNTTAGLTTRASGIPASVGDNVDSIVYCSCLLQ